MSLSVPLFESWIINSSCPDSSSSKVAVNPCAPAINPLASTCKCSRIEFNFSSSRRTHSSLQELDGTHPKKNLDPRIMGRTMFLIGFERAGMPISTRNDRCRERKCCGATSAYHPIETQLV